MNQPEVLLHFMSRELAYLIDSRKKGSNAQGDHESSNLRFCQALLSWLSCLLFIFPQH